MGSEMCIRDSSEQCERTRALRTQHRRVVELAQHLPERAAEIACQQIRTAFDAKEALQRRLCHVDMHELVALREALDDAIGCRPLGELQCDLRRCHHMGIRVARVVCLGEHLEDVEKDLVSVDAPAQ